MKKVLILITLWILSLPAMAQLHTSGGISPSQLVQNVLLGSGVEVSNISYSGASQAIGTFDASNASVGIDEGIIITTGQIGPGPEGPYGPNDKADAGIDNNAGGYPQLSNLVGTSTYNAAILEFDFVPLSDTVKFKYVFASEEYPEYVGTKFNDVFAFFISGPGITGGTKNMALIPNSNDAVAINNVNHLSNTTYYQGNGNGSQSPYNNDPYYVQYDGFTVPMQAVSEVQCGETYHLVIALADVGDPIYDSGIFLEKNSLESIQPVSVDYKLTSDPTGDGQTMAQGCTGAVVTITRSGPKVSEPLTVPITTSGDAIEGVDYSSIPSSVHFSPGQTTISFTIDALNNAALTQIVDLILNFEIEDPCGNDDSQSIELFIEPTEPVDVELKDQAMFCPGEDVVLVPEATGGGGDYTYQWSTGETTPTITVSPATTETYTVSVTDDCLNETATTSAEVTVPVFDPLTVNMDDDIVEQCPFVPQTLAVEAMGGSGTYTYEWTGPNGNKVLSTSNTLDVAPSETTTYSVEVNDQCGESTTGEVTITVLSPPLLLDISPKQITCPGDSVQINVDASGGFGDYYYYWPHSGETTQSVWVTPDTTSVYTVIVKDDCQTFQVSAQTSVEVVKPDANFQTITTPMYTGLPITFQNLTENGYSYVWDLGNGSTSTMTHPNETYSDTGTYNITLIATDRYGCLDTISKPIHIFDEFYLYIPNTFTPDDNRNNEVFEVSTIGVVELHVQIFNRWGELVFSADSPDFKWDGTYDGKPIPDGTYVWKIQYKSIYDDELQLKTGHINVLK